ncbi:hypothetical protein RI367_000246 [Sorochytrium milnesiophthora]
MNVPPPVLLPHLAGLAAALSGSRPDVPAFQHMAAVEGFRMLVETLAVHPQDAMAKAAATTWILEHGQSPMLANMILALLVAMGSTTAAQASDRITSMLALVDSVARQNSQLLLPAAPHIMLIVQRAYQSSRDLVNKTLAEWASLGCFPADLVREWRAFGGQAQPPILNPGQHDKRPDELPASLLLTVSAKQPITAADMQKAARQYLDPLQTCTAEVQAALIELVEMVNTGLLLNTANGWNLGVTIAITITVQVQVTVTVSEAATAKTATVEISIAFVFPGSAAASTQVKIKIKIAKAWDIEY